MRRVKSDQQLQQPVLIDKAQELGTYLKTLPAEQLQKIMHLSPTLAAKTYELIQQWTNDHAVQSPAIDSFIGDIYSGLNPATLSQTNRDYADEVLWILSGLYGFLRPYDSIYPYRLEMGYKFPASPFKNLYTFWGDSIAQQLPKQNLIINTSAKEYTDVITPYIDKDRVITPQFLTIRDGKPTFVAVHAKIARGAFARWLITSRITDPTKFNEFKELNYRYDKSRSTLHEPTFICKTFGGIGLSIRLTS
jgi:cytoplasmic iron level regulating protein YaaA (DUF328/UPF0246 family)